jgi:hypothetical protein
MYWRQAFSQRHDAVRNALAKEARDAGFDVKIEEVGLMANTEERPADVFISKWEYGMASMLQSSTLWPKHTSITA